MRIIKRCDTKHTKAGGGGGAAGEVAGERTKSRNGYSILVHTAGCVESGAESERT